MPVTARLSRLFYDRLGEEIADELVNWFNAVDATYRSGLRELNELNFSRIDAKQEQRLAELEAGWDRRLAELEARWDRRVTELEAKWDRQVTSLDAKWEVRLSAFEARIERRLGEQTRWMFAAWASVMVAVIGLWLR